MSTGKGRRPRGVGTDVRAKDARTRLRGLNALSMALDVVDAAASTVTPDLAIERARAVVAELGPDQARAALTVLAVEAVWLMPLPPQEVRTAQEIYDRQQELRRWVWSRRRVVSDGRRRLRRRIDGKQNPQGGL